jgi:hypothetical protein
LRLPISPRPRDSLVIGGRFNAAKDNLSREFDPQFQCRGLSNGLA